MNHSYFIVKKKKNSQLNFSCSTQFTYETKKKSNKNLKRFNSLNQKESQKERKKKHLKAKILRSILSVVVTSSFMVLYVIYSSILEGLNFFI